jgi:nucleoside-triphosphatase THEP1
MQEHHDALAEIKKLVATLTTEERNKLINEILGDSQNNIVVQSSNKDLKLLKSLWKKHSRPIGSWNRDEIHERE